jgi:histidine triad (HIT) family protein
MPAYDPNNIFAKILRGELPSYKIYEDDKALAFLDIMPRASGHALVLPKASARNILDVSPDDLAHVIKVAQKIAKTSVEVFGADGVTIQQFNESAGGQVVFHLHVHVIPRKAGVALKPPASAKEAPEVLADQAKQLSAALRLCHSPLLRRAIALNHGDVARDRAHHGILAAARDDAVEPGAIDHVERKWLEDCADARYRGRREGNEIGIAAHEAHVLAVRDELHDIAAQERATPLPASHPMQHRAAGKMPAAADERDARRKLQRVTLPQLDHRIGPHDPLPVGGGQVNGNAAKGAAPFHHAAVIVRV